MAENCVLVGVWTRISRLGRRCRQGEHVVEQEKAGQAGLACAGHQHTAGPTRELQQKHDGAGGSADGRRNGGRRGIGEELAGVVCVSQRLAVALVWLRLVAPAWEQHDGRSPRPVAGCGREVGRAHHQHQPAGRLSPQRCWPRRRGGQARGGRGVQAGCRGGGGGGSSGCGRRLARSPDSDLGSL